MLALSARLINSATRLIILADRIALEPKPWPGRDAAIVYGAGLVLSTIAAAVLLAQAFYAATGLAILLAVAFAITLSHLLGGGEMEE